MAVENSHPHYMRNVLYQTDSFEVISINWVEGSTSPQHNHGWSQCMVLVEEGLFENALDLGVKREIQVFEKGQVLNTPIASKHSLRCVSATGKTLHVYVPKIHALTDAGKFSVRSMSNLKKDLHLSEPTRIDRLREIMTSIRDHSVSTESPYFMNQLFSGILPQMLMAEELVSQSKTTLATYEASPAFSTIEAEVIEALCQIIGWPASKREGVSVPGGSAANFMAIHCARQKFLPQIKKNGMSGEKLIVYVSSEAHYSMKKACVVLGLGTDSLVSVPVDERGRMKPSELAELVADHRMQGFTPLLVVATAGTTVLGAFDPIDELALICHQNQLWLHVDGAWGGPALFSKRLRKHVRGIELADSMTFDGHKLFGASLTSSFFLTKHSGLLLEANDVSGGDYLFHSDDPTLDRGKLSWQCGRKAEAMSFWTIWKSLGSEGLGQFVDQLIEIREKALVWIKTQSRLELVANPEYLNLCLRVVPPSGPNDKNWSKKVREVLKEKNLAMVNYSTNEQGTFLRLILAHPFLEFNHVRQILEWALKVGQDIGHESEREKNRNISGEVQ